MHVVLREGRPDGLRLVLRSDVAVRPGSSLTLMRTVDDAASAPYEQVDVDRRIAAALADPGVEFVDREMTPGGHYAYRLSLEDPGGGVKTSAPVEVAWRRPPGRPAHLAAVAPTSAGVEVRWDAKPHLGALVFRRDVLDRSARPRRRAELGAGCDGIFFDRDVEPGGVYAYRVALARFDGGVVQYGTPSEEVYVTVPGEEGKQR